MKKAVKGQQSMYKSTSATVGRKSFIMKEFTPASVSSIDVQISGFPTSYSYYIANEGIDGISKKDVSAANSVSNDWMGPGKAVCTITKSGIPSALLSVKSVSLFVNGSEFPGIKYTVGSDNTITINQTTGHTTWEQKDITAKVVYTTPDGVEFESNVSNTLTRHITGLPYKVNFTKNTNAWSLDGCTLNDNSIEIPCYHKSAKLSFKIIGETKISLKIYAGSYLYGGNTQLNVVVGATTTTAFKNNNWQAWYSQTYGEYQTTGVLTADNAAVCLKDNTWVASYYSKIPGLEVMYN